MTAPSVLLVDDGELDELQALLSRLRVDWVRCLDASEGSGLQRPLDLIVSSGPRTLAMPALRGEGDPVWICLYGQDFLPLREQLTRLGVHFLVSSDLAPRALELFLRQLLHRGAERRRVRRIPFRCEAQVEVGAERRKALLLELSPDGCVFATDEPVPPERRIVLHLPDPSLTGHGDLELSGRILRATSAAPNEVELGVVNVLRFGSLDAETMASLQRVLSGESLDTEVAPLRERPQHPASEEESEAPCVELASPYAAPTPSSVPLAERRDAPRRVYERCADVVRWEGEPAPEIVFARDLSTSGVRVQTPKPPAVGDSATLAFYGGAREEPVLATARVVRVDGEDVGLRFEGLDPARRRDLARLLEAAPRLERLAGKGGSLRVAEVLSD